MKSRRRGNSEELIPNTAPNILEMDSHENEILFLGTRYFLQTSDPTDTITSPHGKEKGKLIRQVNGSSSGVKD